MLEIKETGVLMKPDLAQAAHDGLKTETRRVIKNIPEKAGFALMAADNSGDVKFFSSHMGERVGLALTKWIKSKYGKPGDLIYIKEEHYIYGKWVEDGLTKKTKKPKFNFVDLEIMPVKFPKNKPTIIETNRSEIGYFKRNSLYMPKKYARTWAKIKSVDVEYLNAITRNSIVKEGVCTSTEFPFMDKWIDLWDSINKKRGYSWDSNPFVRVNKFERIER